MPSFKCFATGFNIKIIRLAAFGLPANDLRSYIPANAEFMRAI